MNIIYTIIGIIVAYIIGLFFSKRNSAQDAKVLDLEVKIKQNTDKLKEQEKSADEKTKEYLDALKKYDPDFHSDDDSSGHST